jgi:hypothetical protein
MVDIQVKDSEQTTMPVTCAPRVTPPYILIVAAPQLPNVDRLRRSTRGLKFGIQNRVRKFKTWRKRCVGETAALPYLRGQRAHMQVDADKRVAAGRRLVLAESCSPLYVRVGLYQLGLTRFLEEERATEQITNPRRAFLSESATMEALPKIWIRTYFREV